MKEKLLKILKEKGYLNPHNFFIALVTAGYKGSYQSVLNWCDGKHEPTLQHLQIICKVLEIDVSYFFD